MTGAGGFIGSHLTEKLASEGAETIAFVRYNSVGRRGWLDEHGDAAVRVIHGDVCDAGCVKDAFEGADTVFHLAALIAIPYSYRAPFSYIRSNVEGTMIVLQAALDAGVTHVVHASTSEVYGTAQQVPIDEMHPLRGQSPYAASKIGADAIALSYHLSFGLPVTTVRPFNTYGPRQSARAIIPTIITQALTQAEVRLGNLHPTRDLNYVGDTVEGFLHAGNTSIAVGEVCNIGSGVETSIGALAKAIVQMTGRDTPIITDEQRTRPQKSEVDRLVCDATKASELLGWSSQTSLEDGLATTINWIEANLEYYRPQEYTV